VVGWSAAGAGAVALVIGVVEVLAAKSKVDDAVADAQTANTAQNMAAWQLAKSQYEDASSQRTLGTVLIAAGAVVAAGGAALALIGRGSPEKSGAVAMRVGPWIESVGGDGGGGGILWSGRW